MITNCVTIFSYYEYTTFNEDNKGYSRAYIKIFMTQDS